MSRRVTYFNSSFGLFRPINLAGSQLYFAKNTATPSLWNDQSSNGYDLSQAVASQQPTIGVDTVDFDGSNDVQFRNIADPFISDTQGVIFFSFNNILNTGQRIINISLSNSAGLGRNRLSVEVRNDNRIILFARNTGANNFLITDDVFAAGYNYGYIKSTGSSYEFSVNGSIRTFTVSSGADDGRWFSFVGATDRISMGGLFTGSTVLYTPNQNNKIYYNNTALSPTDIAKLETFFSDPNNY